MINVFVDKYKYDMLCNKKKTCTRQELDEIMDVARTHFAKKENDYQCIIVIFSGHGNQNALVCSDVSDAGKTYIYSEENINAKPNPSFDPIKYRIETVKSQQNYGKQLITLDYERYRLNSLQSTIDH